MSDQAIRFPKRVVSSESAQTASKSILRLKDLPSEDLMAEVQRGNWDALSHLFKRYHRLVLDVALKILHDPEEAEDVLQEVFLEIYQKAYLYDRKKGSVNIWMYQYAYHRSLNRRAYLALRMTANLQEVPDASILEAHYSPNGLEGMLYEELGRLVREALETLGPKQKEVLELTFFDGLLLSDIAESKKESLGNVRNHYYRALKKLRAFLYNGAGKKQNGMKYKSEFMSGDGNGRT